MGGADFYCDLVKNADRAVKVIAETPEILAFEHTRPYWTTHIVVIPKTHIDSVASAAETGCLGVVNEMLKVAGEICRELEKRLGGCKLSTNVGEYQTTKHLHFYIHAGKRLRNEDGSLV